MRFTVETAFQITGRGIVVTGTPYQKFVAGEVHIVRPDGTDIRTYAAIEMPCPSSITYSLLGLPFMKQEDVPVGSVIVQ